MELCTRRLMFVLGGSLLLTLGAVAACNSGNDLLDLPQASENTPTTTKTKDGGTASEGDDAGADDGGLPAICADASAPRSSSDIYCNKDSSGSTLYCKPHPDGGTPQKCCGDSQDGNKKFAPSTCADVTGSCVYDTAGGFSKGNDYECMEARHCGASQVCCLKPGTSGGITPTPDKTYGVCGVYYAAADYTGAKIGGTACKAACGGSDTQLCAKDEECGDGKSCHFVKINGRNAGFCVAGH